MKKLIYLLSIWSFYSFAGKEPNPYAASEQFADSVINTLSLERKVALLHGMGNIDNEWGDDVTFFGIKGDEEAGIPPLHMGTGITGARSGRDNSIHATYFMTPIAMGCTWDPFLYAKAATAIAAEMRAQGQDLNLGPTFNIIRHPLGGRNWESLTEDPFLNSRMAVAFTKAMQSNGIICGPKHFAANNQETNRFDINNVIDERTLREIYLPAFKAAVTEGGALNIMGAYNRVNGTYMCHHKYLIDDILRGEWGFQGFLVSDFGNGLKDTRKGVEAGLNVEMHLAKYYGDSLIEAVKKKEIKEEQVDDLLRDVLKVMHYMGIFERDKCDNTIPIHNKEHINIARGIAQSAPVLLKNSKKTLPLDKSDIKSVAVIGPNAKRFSTLNNENSNSYYYYLQGGGSGRCYHFPDAVVEPFEGLASTLSTNTEILYAQGCKTPDLFGRNKASDLDDEEARLIEEAVSIAREVEKVILFVGLSGFNESEGWDRSSAQLPGQQNKLIQEVSKVNPNTIVVLISGSYVDVSSWINDISTLLFVPYSGEQIGNGIADILTGKVSPSGKLPFTWPNNIDDYPEGSIFRGKRYSKDSVSNIYSEGIFVGYRWFEREDIAVSYPFGYGLSYTDFEYSGITVDYKKNYPVDVNVTLTNTGDRAGAEVVQLYVTSINPGIEKAKKELKGFQKLHLAPGESRTLQFELSPEDFAYYDVEKKAWVVEPGNYRIAIGNNSQSLQVQQSITLNEMVLK